MYFELRRRICLLDYPPGTRLSEEVLATEFGTSRTPLRRVLIRLEGEGLLTSVHGVGTFVTDIATEELAQTYQRRLELAELIGKLDAVPPDGELWAELRALSVRSRKVVQDPDPRSFAELNMDFYLAILRLTNNKPLREICVRLYLQTTRIWLRFHVTLFDMTENNVLRQMRPIILTMLRVSYEFGVVNPDNEKVSREGHIAVAEAIAARDPVAARAAMADMLELNRSIAEDYWLRF